jgi:hypothetical protein
MTPWDATTSMNQLHTEHSPWTLFSSPPWPPTISDQQRVTHLALPMTGPNKS